jgi:hypothetical protein
MHDTVNSGSSTSSSSSGTSISDASSSDATAAASWAMRHRTDVLTQRAAKFNSWQVSHLVKLQVYVLIQQSAILSAVTA